MRFGLRCWLASPFLLLICFAGFSGLGVAGFARFAATMRARYACEVPPLCSQGYFPGASQQHGPPACASPTVSCAERVYYAKIRRPWASPSRRFVFATQVQLAALRPCQRKSSSQDHQSEEDVKERPAATISERRRSLERTGGKSLSDSTVRRLLKGMGISQKNGVWRRWNGTSG